MNSKWAIRVGLLMLTGMFSIANAGARMDGIVTEGPSRLFPGRYFEQKAQFYLKKKDYRMALEMFELSGFWADKIGQYNAGMMYFSGVGVPVDKPRGVAWLRIAAESHGDLAESAQTQAYAQLTPEQQAQADAIWRELDAKYGDRVAVKRALDRYYEEARNVTGSRVGFTGDVIVYAFDTAHNGGAPEYGAVYAREQEKRMEELLGKIAGRVSVGSVKTLDVPDGAKTDKSAEPIAVPPAKSH
jgi:hypothetical protein